VEVVAFLVGVVAYQLGVGAYLVQVQVGAYFAYLDIEGLLPYLELGTVILEPVARKRCPGSHLGVEEEEIADPFVRRVAGSGSIEGTVVVVGVVALVVVGEDIRFLEELVLGAGQVS
jgi:predicted metal-dependent phosphotriesterase family hydrolase